MILGLIWTLICEGELKLNLQTGSSNAKNSLLEWVKGRVNPYGLNAQNFDTHFKDGRGKTSLSHF